MELLDKHIINRSSRAIKCLYLNSDFYKEIQNNGLSAENVLQMKEKYISKRIVCVLKDTKKIENDFLWLIKTGVLRREVDGQGLTSKVRLTPIGRLILEKEPELANQNPSFVESAKNWIYRKLLLT